MRKGEKEGKEKCDLNAPLGGSSGPESKQLGGVWSGCMCGIARQIQHYYIRREGMGGDTGRGGVDIVREGRRSGCNNTPKGGRSI